MGMQQKLMIEQQYKQQTSQLTMAKTQREMAIQQQAAQMTAQATQYQMQVEMQARVPLALARPPRGVRPRAPRARARAASRRARSRHASLKLRRCGGLAGGACDSS